MAITTLLATIADVHSTVLGHTPVWQILNPPLAPSKVIDDPTGSTFAVYMICTADRGGKPCGEVIKATYNRL